MTDDVEAALERLRLMLGPEPKNEHGQIVGPLSTIERHIAAMAEYRDALLELVEVADLRGDSQLPHPSDDPLLWTARMQQAWDDARTILGRSDA